jgi:hypothetical protein
MGDASSINPALLKDLFVLAVVLAGVGASLVAIMRRFRSDHEPRAIHPQPLRISADQRHIDEERYVRDRAEIVARIDHLERTMKRDREALMEEIAAVPHRVIALLKDTKGLL